MGPGVRFRPGPAGRGIWKTLRIAEQTFRRIDAPELLAEIAEGVVYVNRERVKPSQDTADEKAAA